MYFNAQDYQGCIRAAQKAIALRPAYAEAYANICSAYNALHQFEEAAKACEEALKIKPDYEMAKANLEIVNMNYAKSKGLK